MRGPTHCQPVKLTDEHTLHDTMTIVRQQFTLSAAGYVCQTDDLWRLKLAAAARHTTIEVVCADLLTAPNAKHCARLFGGPVGLADYRRLGAKLE